MAANVAGKLAVSMENETDIEFTWHWTETVFSLN